MFNGKLLWPDATGMTKAYLIVISEKVSKEYLAYLDTKNISWIACGKEHVDLVRIAEILAEDFAAFIWMYLAEIHLLSGLVVN